MSKWGDYIARTAVRRVVYIIVGLIVTAVITWATPARASDHETIAQAWAHCQADLAQRNADFGGSLICRLRPNQHGMIDLWYPEGNGSVTSHSYNVGCPADKPFDTTTGTCGNECASKAPMTGVASRGDNGAFCSGGCSYSVDMDSPMRTLGSGAERTTFGTFRASGARCTVDTPIDSYDPNRAICNTVASNNDGTVSQCVRPDGMTCVAMGGARLCYAQGETGDRMTSDGKLATNRVNEGETPKAPANQQGSQHISTTTTTVNNNTTVTSIFSGTGSSPGQSNVGAGGSDGNGNGNGNGEGEGDDNGPGGVGSELVPLYDPEGRSVSDSFNTFKAAAMQTPLIGAASRYFSAPTGGGGCPVWTVPANDWISTPLVFDHFCNGGVDTLLTWAGFVVMALAAFAAWHIFAGN